MKTKLTFMIVAIVAVIASGFQKTNAQNTSPFWSLAGNSNATSTSKLGTTNAINLRLLTNNTERMRITTSGLVGVGTASPTERLHVNSVSGANAFRAQVNGSTKLLVHSGGGVSLGSGSTPPANGLYVSGNVGIGTTAPQAKLDVVGPFTGIRGKSVDQTGVIGISETFNGVEGVSTSWFGVAGSGETGVFGSGFNVGVYGETTSGGSAGFFDGNVLTTGEYLISSDAKLKKNIKEVDNAIDIINRLQPKNYEYRNDGSFGKMHLPNGKHYGLLAQDLEKVLPGLVKETHFNTANAIHAKAARLAANPLNAEAEPALLKNEIKGEIIDFKAVNYTELIPIVIKAMQEQEVKIQKLESENKDQNSKIEALTLLVNKLQHSGTETSVKLSGISLGQNVPNPANTNTTINYSIPAGTTSAELIVTNAAGQSMKQIKLNSSGRIDINTSTLRAGTYFYTLYVNGRSISTKKMILNR